MPLPFSVALQLALVLACVPAITLTVLAAQISPSVDSQPPASPMRYGSASNVSVSQAQKLIPAKDVSTVIVAASETSEHKDHKASPVPGTKPASSKGLIPAKGVVLKVDRANGTVEINHDPIPALDWPEMTMSFRLKESALTDQVKEGDKVEFFLEKSDSDYAIVKFGKPASTKASP